MWGVHVADMAGIWAPSHKPVGSPAAKQENEEEMEMDAWFKGETDLFLYYFLFLFSRNLGVYPSKLSSLKFYSLSPTETSIKSLSIRLYSSFPPFPH